MSGRWARRGVVLVCTALSSIAATATASSTTALPAPGASWQKVAPASVGLDAAVLGQIAARARRGRSNCLVVVRNGKLAGEWYFNGTRPTTAQDVFSVTKSFAGTLVGIAQDDGDLRLGAPAAKWISEWRGTKSESVTLRELLSMDSGRAWDVVTDYLRLLAARDRTRFAIGLGQAAAPGTVWAYNNSAVQTLDRVLERATRMPVAAFAEQRLFRPLGMRRTTMAVDRAGNAQLFEGMRSTCRDLARFGVLMLDRGRWHGRQVVSRSFVDAATSRPSSPLNAAYGYLWWLNRQGVVAGVTAATSLGAVEHGKVERGRMVPGAPASTYWALGLGNQLIQIDPSTRTVVVRLGSAVVLPVPPTFGPGEASAVVTDAVIRR